MPLRTRLAIVLVFLLSFARPAGAYFVLTHEQLIDLTWQSSIVPLLLSRYPTLTPAQIEHAHAYAYGGCVIQDIGYYPFGDATFSDLTHYVRSGDFVVNLFRNAGNADELAFAVGALSHYIGDNIGHATATKKDSAAWAEVQQDLTVMRTIPTSTEHIPYPTYGDGSGDANSDTLPKSRDSSKPSL